MRSTRLLIPNRQGESLAARLDLPAARSLRGCALFAHCFTCSKDLNAVGNISRALTASGIGVLRFDFTGLGESEGDFADTNFSSNVEDLRAAADYLASEVGPPRLLIGHSLGGAAVLQAAQGVAAAAGVVTIGAPAEPSHVLKLLAGSREEIEAKGSATVQLAGRPFTIRKQFLDDLEERRMTQAIRNLKKALLVFHSPLDNTVGIENAAQIFKAARHPKSFISLDRADHLLRRQRDSRYVGSVIAAWADRYLEPASEPAGGQAPEQGISATIGTEHYRTVVRARSHQLLADEPAGVGGTDLGPTPYELLSAALGTCTGITLRMYADRKQWPVEGIHVEVSHSRVHAEDCAECETADGRVDVLEQSVAFEGPLSEEQLQRLAEVSTRCPVHRTLESEIVIRDRPLQAPSDRSET